MKRGLESSLREAVQQGQNYERHSKASKNNLGILVVGYGEAQGECGVNVDSLLSAIRNVSCLQGRTYRRCQKERNATGAEHPGLGAREMRPEEWRREGDGPGEQ